MIEFVKLNIVRLDKSLNTLSEKNLVTRKSLSDILNMRNLSNSRFIL